MCCLVYIQWVYVLVIEIFMCATVNKCIQYFHYVFREEKTAKLSVLKEEKQQQGEVNRLKTEAKALEKKTVEFEEFKVYKNINYTVQDDLLANSLVCRIAIYSTFQHYLISKY